MESSPRLNSVTKRIQQIAGYTFQWLKKQIINTIKENLRITICVDIARAVEYSIPSDAQKKLDFADKFDSRLQDLEARTVDETNETMGNKSRTLKRFTMLSKSALYQQAYGGVKRNINNNNGSNNNGSSNNNNNNSNGINNNGGNNSINLNDGTSNIDWNSSELLNAISDEINPSDQNIFTCPILSHTIQYKCIPLWWDALREEASLGICNALLSPNRTANFGEYNQLSTPIDVIVPFRSNISEKNFQGIPPISIKMSSHIIERNFMKILSDIPTLGIFGSFSCGKNIFDDADIPLIRRPRSVLGRRLSLLATAERKALLNR